MEPKSPLSMLSLTSWHCELSTIDSLALRLSGGQGPRSAPPKKCTTATMCLHRLIHGKSLQLQVVVIKSIWYNLVEFDDCTSKCESLIFWIFVRGVSRGHVSKSIASASPLSLGHPSPILAAYGATPDLGGTPWPACGSDDPRADFFSLPAICSLAYGDI